jgi:protein-tyrosine phosphatase
MLPLCEDERLRASIEVDSAGTGDWHVGEPPDGRAEAAGERRGLSVRGRARQITARDFDHFDYLLAMDRSNRAGPLRLAPSEDARAEVVLFRSFDPSSPRNADVPDPYYGGGDGFERVLDICEAACRGLLQHIRENHRP